MKSSTLQVGTIEHLSDEDSASDEPVLVPMPTIQSPTHHGSDGDLEAADVFAAASNPFLAKGADDIREASFNVTDPEHLADATIVDPNRPIVPASDVYGDAIDNEVRGSIRFEETPTLAEIDKEKADQVASVDDDFFQDDEIAVEIADLESGRTATAIRRSTQPHTRSSLIVPELPTDQEKADATRRSVAVTGTQLFRYLYSLGLLVFSIVVVMAALFTGQTTAADKNIPPAGAFFIFWFLIVWLATVSACASIGISFVQHLIRAIVRGTMFV